MCTHQRWIFNPYSRQKVLVPCGKCESCLQSRANKRASRIRFATSQDGTLTLFVTLTYAPKFLPYILRGDVDNASLSSSINLYRDASIRRSPLVSDSSYIVKDGVCLIDTLPVYDCLDWDSSFCKSPNGSPSDRISVCYFRDIQDFFKRLRQNLIRHYHYEKQFSYFVCSEYGSYSQRAHFHALIIISKDDVSIFESAILESWPYAFRGRTKAGIEIARNAASYVSSYLCGNFSLPSLLQDPLFKPKHSMSKGFGTFLDCFSLSSLLEKVRCGDFYIYRESKVNGESTSFPLPIPFFVVNRYFPKFKGFGRLDSSQLREFLYTIITTCEDVSKRGLSLIEFRGMLLWDTRRNHLPGPYDFTNLDTYVTYVSIYNAYLRCRDIVGFNIFDYIEAYISIWICYACSLLKYSYNDDDVRLGDYSSFYTNVVWYDDLSKVSPTLSPSVDYELDPNRLHSVVRSDVSLVTLFYQKDKTRKVTNYSNFNIYGDL